MIKSDISIFGAALIVILLFLSVAVYAHIDRREMLRTMKVFGLLTGQTALVAFGMWIAYRQDSCWILLLWLLLITGLSMAWCLYELRSQWRQQLLPVIASMAAGLLVGFGSMMLCVPSHYYIPVLGVISAFLALSVVQTFQTYQRCLFHTAAHRQYMQANGATLLESLMPSIRRALRAAVQPQLRIMAQPLLVVVPLLFGGMLLGGASPVVSFVSILLLMSATFTASVVAAIVALYCFKR